VGTGNERVTAVHVAVDGSVDGDGDVNGFCYPSTPHQSGQALARSRDPRDKHLLTPPF
jgi:hypothetical protein